MRIAFDLDDTLIPSRTDVPLEHGIAFAITRLIFRERLRQGTRQLLRQLTQEGHDIWLYTTSLRSPFMLGMWFWCLGIRLGGVINQTRHTQVLRQFSGPERHVNKYPPAFEIDWLIDDSIGVKEDGARYGFSVIHIQPDDLHWVSTLRQTLISANVLA